MIHPLQKYLKDKNKTHIIFDFDETIVKLVLPWEKSIDRIKDELNKLDSNLLEEYTRNKISFNVLQNTYFSKFGEKALKLFLKNNSEFEKNDLKEYLKNEVIIKFIEEAEKYKLSIWSSNMKPTIKKILSELRILDKFQELVSREDVKLLKPSIEGFEKLYNGGPKSNYLFIGDSRSDKEVAEKVEIDFYLEEFFNFPGKYW